MFTEHDFTHSKHYVLPAERVTDAFYETLSAAFNKLGEYALSRNVSLASRITAARRRPVQDSSGCSIGSPFLRRVLPAIRLITRMEVKIPAPRCRLSKIAFATRTGRMWLVRAGMSNIVRSARETLSGLR